MKRFAVAHIIIASLVVISACNPVDTDSEQIAPGATVYPTIDEELEPQPSPITPLMPQDWEEEIIDADVATLASRTMPVVRITTDNGRSISSQTTYVSGSISFEDPAGRYTCIKSNGGRMKIRGRGKSSWGMPKKPYRIKLDEPARVFGMPVNRDWTLIASYSDKTLMRNQVAMYISELVGLSWSPKIRQCNVYLNGSYIGVYGLTEFKEVARSKVDIDPEKGDFYLEIESSTDGHRYIDTRDMRVQFKDPSDPTTAEYNYIKNYLSTLEAAMASTNRGDPVKGYSAYMEVDSFINFFILQELSKNIDGNMRKSSFMVKHAEGKLELYHTWDFDLAFGNADYFSDWGYSATNGPEGWFVRDYGCNGYHYTWYYHLFKDPGFCSRLKARWNELYPALLKDIPAYIEDQYTLLNADAASNFKKWNILYTYVWPNYFSSGSYRQHVDFMKNYYLTRLAWLNTEINKL